MEITGVERDRLVRRARVWIALFMFGLFLSGVTAFPLQTELGVVVNICDRFHVGPAGLVGWLHTVHDALVDENVRYPFLAYGTDWLAFAHLVLAVLFIGPYRDPVRNKWVLMFGLIACAGVPVLAFVAGAVRGTPVYWRLIDCSFGVVGALVLWPAYRAVQELERA